MVGVMMTGTQKLRSRTKTVDGLMRSAAAQPAPELTILMPCLNEAETLETCIRKARGFLEAYGVDGEVLVADNGSTDGSQDIARTAGARVVPVGVRGYGAALMGGIKAAYGRYVIMGDADDSYDFTRLEAILERLRAGDELVMGNRFRGGIKPGAMPFLHRYLGNPVLSFLGRLFFHVPVGDFHCGLRGFSREAIVNLGLVSPGMEFASEMVVKASLNHLRFSEVPVTLSPDGRTRAPHLKTWRDGWRHLRFLLLHSPTWLFLLPGLSLLLLGLVGIGLLLPGPLHVGPHTVLDTHTLLAAGFAVVVGSQLVSFSLLARRYAAHEGFLPPVRNLPRIINGMTLERVLLFSLALLLCGGAASIWALWSWATTGFGPILHSTTMRVLITALTSIAVSIQLAAGAFFASVFSIRRANGE
jgi:hypothetical protein